MIYRGEGGNGKESVLPAPPACQVELNKPACEAELNTWALGCGLTGLCAGCPSVGPLTGVAGGLGEAEAEPVPSPQPDVRAAPRSEAENAEACEAWTADPEQGRGLRQALCELKGVAASATSAASTLPNFGASTCDAADRD